MHLISIVRRIVLVAALLVAGGTTVGAGVAHAALAPTADLVQTADSLYAQGLWVDAAQAFRALTAADPDNARYWGRYGMSLHQLGLYDEAVMALRRAEELGHHPITMYNLACALSRNDQPDEALNWLRRAAENGFTNLVAVESDDDLEPLRGHPRWVEVKQAFDRAARPCEFDDRFRQFDFWIGDWNVVNHLGQPAGQSRIERILNSCVLLENWTGLLGMSGKSFNFIDPQTGQWRQTWVDDKGDAHEYAGEFVDGEIRFQRESRARDGHLVLHKLTFFHLAPGHVRQLGEHSDDDGATWVVDYDLHYHRKGT
jgi:tetratricopeptide (TPR) repeat protein